MTENKRFIDIEIGADIGQIRLYTTDEDYETYGSEDILNLLNEQHETITTLTSALKELKEIGDYQAMRITELDAENQKLNHRRQEDINELAIIAIKYKALEEENKALKDIKNICKKYNIKLEDVAETLEEYICLDNGEEL